MAPLRKQSLRHEGLTVNYSDEITEDQGQKIDKIVHEEFQGDDWVTVEQES